MPDLVSVSEETIAGPTLSWLLRPKLLPKGSLDLCKREYWVEDVTLALCEVLLPDRVLRTGTQKLKMVMGKK